MWKHLARRVATIAAVAMVAFGAAACADGGIDLEDSPDVEEAPFGGTEDPIKETPAPGSS